MPVVAVINRKGGSGKSTLATHLAGYCAGEGRRVMLGDVDRQQSSLAWLRRRAGEPLAQGAGIVGWAVDPRSVMRPPAGVTHVVLDTPGGLRGFDLARVAMAADAILMPVCDAAFDRESAAACHAELMTLPRITGGRCKVAMVGMRIDARTKGATRLGAWAAELGVPYLGSVRESQLYVRSAEQGLTLFDLPPSKVEADLAQWRGIVDWLERTWEEAERLSPKARPGAQASAARSPPRPAASLAGPPAGTPVRALPIPAPEPALALATASSMESRPTLSRIVPPRPAARLGWLFNVFRSST